MSEINSTSYGKQWVRSNSGERQIYLRRVCLRLSGLGITPPSPLLLEQCMTEITSELCNADLDVGRMFERAMGELRQTS